MAARYAGAGSPSLCPSCYGPIAGEPRGAQAEARLGRLVRIPPDDPRYADIKSRFDQALPAAKLSAIYAVENPALQAIYSACRSRMEHEKATLKKDAKGPNEASMHHGTTRAAAGSIVREGFNMHMAGKANGTVLGVGIYVANSPRISHPYTTPDSAGTRAMFICDVLLGAQGVDSNTSGGASVVFREQQVLPRALVYYRA